jgi:hypothetical protein
MDYYLVASLGIAVILGGVYFYLRLRKKKTPELPHVLGLLFSSFSIPAAVKLGILGLTTDAKELAPFAGEDRAYVLAGAVALFWGIGCERHSDPPVVRERHRRMAWRQPRPMSECRRGPFTPGRQQRRTTTESDEDQASVGARSTHCAAPAFVESAAAPSLLPSMRLDFGVGVRRRRGRAAASACQEHSGAAFAGLRFEAEQRAARSHSAAGAGRSLA